MEMNGLNAVFKECCRDAMRQQIVPEQLVLEADLLCAQRPAHPAVSVLGQEVRPRHDSTENHGVI